MQKKILRALSKEPETRTTFTLSVQGKESLEYLTKELGLTQKQVFNNFIRHNDIDNDLKHYALENDHPERAVRKSVVITRETLGILNDAAKELKIQRDGLVDNGLEFLSLLFKSAVDDHKMKYNNAKNQLIEFLENAREVEENLSSTLGHEDTVLKRISTVIISINDLIRDIENNIENGVEIAYK